MAYTRLGPFVDGGAPYLSAATFNHFEDTLALAGTGIMAVPPATGVAATDTANFQAAIATANANFLDLRFSGKYQINAPLTWNANTGSLFGTGDAILDFYSIGRNVGGTSFTGPALTITGNGTAASPSGNPLNHVGTKYRVEGFKLNGPDTDSGTIDGILFTDPGIGIDFVTVRHVQIYGMRDGVTYGDNTWSQSIERSTIANAHRYGVNLTSGTNTGECTTFTSSSIYGTHNASNGGVAVYAPAGSNVEFRMFGGSLDYNDMEGAIYGGALTFDKVHIEDNRTGAMFIYSQSAGLINVSFRDCAWDSSATAPRPYLHQVLAGSGSKITVTFDGDKGGLYPNTNTEWFHDSSGNASGDLGIASTIRGWAVDPSTNSGMLGQFYNLLTNGDFGSSSSFVASPGVGGWASPGTGSWSIGAGGNPGSALKLIASTAVSANTSQRIPLPASRQPVRVAGKMMVTALTAGSVQAAVQFYAADGTTPVLGTIRIGTVLTTVDATNWTYFNRRFTPPPGAAYLSVQLGANAFVGTALWDEIEAVPV